MPRETKKDTKAKKNTKSSTQKKTNKKVVVEKPVVKEEKVEVVKSEGKACNCGDECTCTDCKCRRNTPLYIAICIIVVLLIALIAVSSNKRIPKTSDGDEILATVNGKTFTANDLYKELKNEYGTDSLIYMIDNYIADKEVTFTEENKEYIQEIVDYYVDYAEYYEVTLGEFLENYVGISGITTKEEFYNYVEKDYKKSLAIVNFIGDKAKEEDLKKFYEENYSDTLTVKHILITVDEDETEAEALQDAKIIIAALDKVSESEVNTKFEELALNYSDDTSTYSKGGLLDPIEKNDVVEEFWNAAYALKDGEYTKEPVKTTYGYHIILRVSSTPVKAYEEIKDDVKEDYAQSLLSKDNTLYSKKWRELRKEYKLTINDDVIKAAYENTNAED